MRVLLVLLLIAAPVCAAEVEERELWCEEVAEADGAEICARRTTQNEPRVRRPLVREPAFVILSPQRGRMSTMPPVTTRTRRVRLGRNGRVTVGY